VTAEGEDPQAVRAVLETLIRRFFAAVSFESGQRPTYDVLHELFIEDGKLIKAGGARPEIMTVEQFIEPRQRSVDSGELSAFHESETAEITEVFGDVAHRFSRILRGTPAVHGREEADRLRSRTGKACSSTRRSGVECRVAAGRNSVHPVGSFWFSMYSLMTVSGAPPQDPAKYDGDHRCSPHR
jgi:hypothetical protein